MYLYAYRRKRNVFGHRADITSCIARYHPETYTLQLLTQDRQALVDPTPWTNPRVEGPRPFYDWVKQYPTIWSLEPSDAFWFDEELAMDMGL